VSSGEGSAYAVIGRAEACPRKEIDMCYHENELRSDDCYGYRIEKDIENRESGGCGGCRGGRLGSLRLGCCGCGGARRNRSAYDRPCGGLCGRRRQNGSSGCHH